MDAPQLEDPDVQCTIRDYLPSDETAWLRCHVLAFLDTAYFDAVERAKPRIAAPGVELEATTEDGKLVGMLDLAIENGSATIETIAVHPDYRCHGIGKALLEEARHRARPLNVTTLEAWTRDDPSTSRWYHANGFTESDHYLHVYADLYTDPDEPVRAIGTRRPGLRPVKVFLHANLEDEGPLRRQFTRVHVCRRFSRKLDQ